MNLIKLNLNKLVNSSLNWASIAGLFLIIIWIPAIASGVFRIWITLTKRADKTPIVILKILFEIFYIIGRAFMIPLAGGILFFQGWRLSPEFQLTQVILVFGIAGEMVPPFINDFLSWRRSRSSKLSASISLKEQPSDK
tara:strand:- start:617 stop:1033 length:417 start_codon:yes stop_codon:yes gene_type:complete